MKKLLMLIIVVVFSMSISFAANVKVQINGEIIDFTDSNGDKVEAQTINGRTMVPLRKIFEVLGCKVEWNGSTKEITATKDNRAIKMQIDNKDVSFTVNGKNENKTLDQAPIIKDNRTLVPLRFISEALDMQVGWDAQSVTAIIIDYQELANIIKDKSPYLHDHYTNSSNVTITKNYYDDADSSNNCTTQMQFAGNNNIKISGTSDFVSEVKNEEWDNFNYTVIDDNNYETTNYVFSKMLGINKSEKAKIDFERFEITNYKCTNLAEYIKTISSVDDSMININTYQGLKNDWNKFATVFLSGQGKKLVVDNFIFDYIDLNKLFTVRTNNYNITALQLFNYLMFKVSGDYNALFYDFPSVTYSFSTTSNSAKFVFNLKNEYKEREEYVIEFAN